MTCYAKHNLSSGENVSRKLRELTGSPINTPAIIEAAYNFQAGSYVEFAEQRRDYVEAYSHQLADYLSPHLRPGDTVLDVGAGEMTTLAHLAPLLRPEPDVILACDISPRRLAIGIDYARQNMGGLFAKLRAFRAEISALPLADKSVDVVTSNHAIEPNGGREAEVLAELLRVARRRLVMFEPCWEIAGAEARRRMLSHGYVKDLAEIARRVGGCVESVRPMALIANPLNPTACFVISHQWALAPTTRYAMT